MTNHISHINGIPIANISYINGIPVANVSAINGVDFVIKPSNLSYIGNVLRGPISTQAFCSAWFIPDGSRIFLPGAYADNTYEFTCPDVFDVSTASFVSSKAVISGWDNVKSTQFDNAGTTLYMTTIQPANKIGKFTTSPFDIATAVVVSQYTSSNDTNGPVIFNGDKSKMFCDGVFYSLSSPGDLSTASVLYSMNETHRGYCINENGTDVYVVTEDTHVLSRYPLSTSWDYTTIGAEEILADLSSELYDDTDNTPGFSIYEHGGVIEILVTESHYGNSSHYIHQWRLS